MATKPGGGSKQENYDPNTGKYVASGGEGYQNDKTGLKTYHSGSGKSTQEIVNEITSGAYGQDFADYYNQADAQTQQEMIEYVHSTIDEANTQGEKQQRFTPMGYSEYKQFQYDAIANSGLTVHDWDVIDHYVGTGSTSFYLNTAMRLGYDEMLKQFMAAKGYDPNSNPNDYLSRQNVEEFKNVMERATHSCHAPRDMVVDRYIGTGPLVSWLGKTGVLDGIPTENNGWHDRLVKGTYSLQDLADRLTALVGSIMPRDGSFLSFSACPELSHMKNKTGVGSKSTGKKDILIKFDVPKGQDMLITRNSHESEGMFPNDLDFFVKDVKVERDGGTGPERVVLYYGIKKQ